MNENWESWKKWALQENPYGSELPGEWNEKLSKFDKLILIKAYRNELLQMSMAEFII